jgi:superfamily II DNA/RNA helicase
MLRQLLRDAKDLKNAIIFCNRKREVALLYKSLQKHGFSVGALHGDMDQSARTASLDQFRKGELPLLVASDVAARGLDIPEVSHVFNFDVPHHPDDYVHRIGRTGRAGRLGTAISIVSPADQKSVAAIEKLIGQPITRADVALVASSEASPSPAREHHTERAPEDRKPRRDSQRTRGGRNKPRKPEAAEKPAAVAAQPPSIGRALPPAAAREQHAEPADHSHLPAFLLRPVRARG